MWYYGLTTVWGSQTLGEEYCNIVQVGPRRNAQQKLSAPGFLRRTLAILIQLLGPYTVEKLLGYVNQRVANCDLPLQLNSRQYKIFGTFLDVAEELVSTASLLHLALFYIHGVFYQFSKRVSGIRYFAIRSRLTDVTQRSTYRLLGWLVLCQVAMKLLSWAWKLHKWRNTKTPDQQLGVATSEMEDSDNDGPLFTVARDSGNTLSRSGSDGTQIKCPLCLEVCRGITATPCGHLFCWRCVAEWTSERSECPVCRADVEPQTLVALQHFAL